MDSFELTCKFPATAENVYAAWLNSELHSQFTGSIAAIQNEVESRFTAWDGYITGRILELEENKRILQSWRTSDFHMDDDDSIVELEFIDHENGCKLHLKHWNIPEGQSAQYMSGWDEHYFKPMLTFFKKN